MYAQVIRKSYYHQGMLSDLAQSMVVVLSAVLWSYSLFDIHRVNVLITQVKGFLNMKKSVGIVCNAAVTANRPGVWQSSCLQQVLRVQDITGC